MKIREEAEEKYYNGRKFSITSYFNEKKDDLIFSASIVRKNYYYNYY